jgi:hypothetical protein
MVSDMNPAALMGLASLASSLIGGLTGSKGETGSTYSKPQRQGINDILNSIKQMKGGAQDITQQPGYGQGLDWLMSMFNDPQFFDKFEAPLQRQFQEQTVPDLANRFASMGSGGALGSTGFRNQLAREGSNLSTNIAALRGGMQQAAVPQLLGYSQQPFSNLMSLYQQALQPTQNTYQPPSTGFFGGLAAPFAQGAASIWGQQAGQQAGNPGQQNNFQPQPFSRTYPGQSPLTY